MSQFHLGAYRAATALAILMASSGCRRLTSLPRPAPDGLALAGFQESMTVDRTIAHNAGSVLAGQPLRHVFAYRNETRGDLQRCKDHPIRTSCGCTHVQLSREDLVPGESADLTIEIDTDNRLGEIAESATVTWQATDGTLQHCQFTLGGQVTSAFAFDPPELTFSKYDLRTARRKTVRCRSDLPVDWQQVSLKSDADYLDIESLQVDTRAGELVFSVLCSPTHQGETRRATIRLAGPPLAAEASSAIPAYHARLPIYSDDLAALRIAPTSPTLRPGGDALSWQGYLILTGDQIAAGVRLQQISAHGCTVRFRTSPLGDSAQRVDLTVLGPGDVPPADPLTLQLTFSNRLRTSVSFRLQPPIDG